MIQNFDETPSIEQARQDKIFVDVDGWQVGYENEEQFENFLHILKRPENVEGRDLLDERGDLIPLEEEGGWMFTNRSHPPGSSHWSLKVSKKLSNGINPRPVAIPLFGGKAIFRRRPSLREGRSVCSIRLELALNPTRFADCFIDGPPYRPYTPRGSYRSRPQSLDGNDNFLRDYSLSNHGGDQSWREVHQSYLQVVIGAIQSEFQRAAISSECAVDLRSTEFKLKECEVYWEKQSEDALQELRSLVPSLKQIGRETRISTFPEPQEANHGNCVSLRIPLLQGVFLSVYAKTINRIRFEIIFKISDYHNGVALADSQDALLGLIDGLTIDAAERATGIFEHVRLNSEEAETQIALEDFLRDLNQSVTQSATATEILSILIQHRAIHPTSQHLRRIALRLVSRGILTGGHKGGPFPLSAPARSMMDSYFPLDRPS